MRERKQIDNRERQHGNFELTRDDAERIADVSGSGVAVGTEQQARVIAASDGSFRRRYR